MVYTVAAVEEALGLLIHIANAPGLGLTELAKRSGNTKARTFRLLTTLEDRDFVQRKHGSATYILGVKALLVGFAAQNQVSLVRQAEKYLLALGAKFNENVLVRVRNGFETVTVAMWECNHEVRVHGIGTKILPLHAGSSSKVLLAFAPEEVRQSYLELKLHPCTDNTITQRSKLVQELDRIKRNGYATSFGESFTDVAGVAVPVFDHTNRVAAALGFSIPSTRFGTHKLEDLVDALRESAQKLSAELGYNATSNTERTSSP